MADYTLKILTTTSLVLFSILAAHVSAEAQTPSIQMLLSSENVAPGSTVNLKIKVSAPSPINAFDITLQHSPDKLEFVGASTQNSIASIWQSFPLKDSNGKLRLVGGMTTAFSGDNGEIITLTFRAKSVGSAIFVAEKADVALADGKGTLLSGGLAQLGLNITASKAPTALAENKAATPKISDVVLTEDPATKNSIVMLRTANDGAIKEVQMRSRNWFLWGDWQKAQLIASIPNYAWAVELKTLGWDNTESSTILYRWPIAGLKLLAILAFLIILFYASRPFYKMWKRNYIKNS